ncbi:hypothetical protein ACXR0O_13740 [Verrucomicrobiota bacterium sgz303538]
MLDFPESQLQRIKRARIDSLLMDYGDRGICVEYCLSIDLQAFQLDEEDEPFERSIELVNLPLNGATNWQKISGVYRYDKDEIQGTLPVRHQWLPVDAPFLELRYLGGTRFDVDCELFFEMEAWDDCYRNFTSFFSFEAEFTGYENQKQLFEPKHNLSTTERIYDFVAAHLDVSAYRDFNVEGVFITMKPFNG